MTSQKAFTILEILITVIILGIIAAFAIPNYTKSVSQTHLQDALAQLTAIRSANQIYYAKTAMYWPNVAGTQDVSAINTKLSLNIIENAMTYRCDCAGACDGRAYSCTATASGSAYIVSVNQGPVTATNPGCTSGACP